MVSFLSCCLWPRPPTEPQSLMEIQNDLRDHLAQRRQLAEEIVDEGQGQGQLSSTMNDLWDEFERRVNSARSWSRLDEENDEEICKYCPDEQYPRYRPSPARASDSLLESEFPLAAIGQNLGVVSQEVCRLQDEYAEALSRECQGLHLAREELDKDSLLPAKPLKILDPVDNAMGPASIVRPLQGSFSPASVMATGDHDNGQTHESVKPQIVDWDAKFSEALRKLQASRAHVRRLLEIFNENHHQPGSGPQGEQADALHLQDHSTHSRFMFLPAETT